MSETTRAVNDVSRRVRKKLEFYMNQERREGKFDPSGRGYGTTKTMWQYDVLYRVLETTILDKSSPGDNIKELDGKDRINSSAKEICPRLEENSRRVVTTREAERLTNYAKEIFEQQPLTNLQILHRYRPKHLTNIKDIPENGKVQNYTQHVGSCLHSQRYINYYVNEGLQTGKKENAGRLQKLKSPGHGLETRTRVKKQTVEPLQTEEIPNRKSALRGKNKKTSPKSVRFKSSSAEEHYKAENTPLIRLKVKDDSGYEPPIDPEDGNPVDDWYDDDVFEEDDEPGRTDENQTGHSNLTDNFELENRSGFGQMSMMSSNVNKSYPGSVSDRQEEINSAKNDGKSKSRTNSSQTSLDDETSGKRIDNSYEHSDESMDSGRDDDVQDVRSGSSSCAIGSLTDGPRTSHSTSESSSTVMDKSWTSDSENKSICTYASVEHVTEIG